VRSGVWKLSSIDGEAVWGNLIDNGHQFSRLSFRCCIIWASGVYVYA
jgi:hypothetical protein